MKIALFLLSITILYANEVIYLSNPYSKRYSKKMLYAKNIWDMQLYNNKIYLGAGNSSNFGAAKNAGRVPVICYDLKMGNFYQDYTVAEEQIDIYKVYNNILYIPGHDATQNWSFGNFYEKIENKKWKKYRTIPKALHVYDLIKKDDNFYVALGLKSAGAVAFSKDKKNWNFYKIIPHNRVYSLIELNDKIFIDKDIVGFKFKAIRITKLNKTSFLYIKAKKYNDHQSKPIGLYYGYLKNDKIISKKISLPRGFKPYDILKKQDKIYILLNKKQDSYYKILIIELYNFKYKKVLDFWYGNLARSFEKYKSSFYIGIGCDLDNINKYCGDILEIKH